MLLFLITESIGMILLTAYNWYEVHLKYNDDVNTTVLTIFYIYEYSGLRSSIQAFGFLVVKVP
jgi:hypothetical protein